MNIVCVICSDLLTPSDDIYYTPCGHIFHFACLSQWLERSRSCPQCREKATQSKIHRIYFNFSNNDTVTEDPTSLQANNDSLKFQVLIKEREVKQSQTKIETLKKETAGLRVEVRHLESQLAQKETAFYAVKEQVKYFKELSSESENAKKEVLRLKKKLDELRSVQMLLNAPSEDVDEIIKNTREPSILVTYICVMKRELSSSVEKRKELRKTLRQVQQDLTRVSMERNYLTEEHTKRKQLEEELAICESQKFALQNRIRELTNEDAPSERPKGIAVKRSEKQEPKNKKTPHVETQENVRVNDTVCVEPSTDFIDLSADSPPPRRKRPVPLSIENDDDTISLVNRKIQGNEENSPLLQIKSQRSEQDLHKRKSKFTAPSSSYSILSKKPRLGRIDSSENHSSESAFDGFGGHAKHDRFPSSRKIGTEAKKAIRGLPRKPAKLDDGNNRKLGDFMPSYEWEVQRTSYSPKPDLVDSNRLRNYDRSLAQPVHNITSIDAGRMKEIDGLYQAVQLHREQYKDHTSRSHPLKYFKSDEYSFQIPSSPLAAYLFKYPETYTSYKVPSILPLTYERATKHPYLPEFAIPGVYTRGNCIAYKR